MLGVALVPAARRIAAPRGALIALAVWALLVIAAVVLAPGGPEAPVLCTFRRVTGMPCPTCGATRAGLAMLDGRPLDALRLNPLIVSLGAIALAWAVVRFGFGRRVALRAPRAMRLASWAILAILVALNWVWVVRVTAAG